MDYFAHKIDPCIQADFECNLAAFLQKFEMDENYCEGIDDLEEYFEKTNQQRKLDTQGDFGCILMNQEARSRVSGKLWFVQVY